MPRGTPRVSPPLSAPFLCWCKTFGSKKKCFSIALRHTLVVLEMH